MGQSIRARLIKGSLWVAVARAIVNGLTLISTFILAWHLSPSDFGVVAIGTTLLAIVSSVTELSLAEALVRHSAPQRSHFNAAFTLNAARGLVLCLVVAASAYPMAAFFEDERLVGVVLALSVSLLLGGLVNPYVTTLQRELIFWQVFVISVVQKLAGFIAAVSIAVIYQSYWALVIGTLASQAANVAVTYLVRPFRPGITFRHFREFFAFSGWLAASQIVNTLNWRFDTLLVGKLLGSTSLGYYSMGSNVSSMATREATAPLTQPVYAGFANLRDDRPRLAEGYQRVQALVTAVALPVGVGTAVIAEPLIRLTMGEKWLPIVFIVQALASVFAFQTLGSLVQPLAMAMGETRLIFDRDLKLLLVRVPAITLGLVFYGLAGAVAVRVFTGLLSALVNMFMVRRIVGVGLGRQLFANLRAIVSVVVMAAGVNWASQALEGVVSSAFLTIACLSALGGALYCGTSLALWLAMRRPAGPEAEVLATLSSLLGKVRPAWSAPPQ